MKIQYGYDNDNCPAIWHLNTSLKDYCCNERDSGDNYLFRDYIGDITVVLDNYVKILEDNIEEIEELPDYNYSIKENRDKINELVKVINALRKEKEK